MPLTQANLIKDSIAIRGIWLVREALNMVSLGACWDTDDE
jgi:hypothetical protein